jgi:flagellar hook-associated protein 1
MGATDLFIIGSSGTRAFRAAMGAVAENISNSSTEGYTRKAVSLIESPASQATTVFYKPGVAFGGVAIGKITRFADAYLDSAARQTGMSLGSAGQRSRWMSDIQTALNDGPLGVGQQTSGMFSAVERLASNPTDTTLRTNVLFAFEQINVAFKQTSDDLKAIRSGVFSEATNDVAALNDAVRQLASANEGLRRSVSGSPAESQLLDSRDQALVNITKRINVALRFKDHGVAEVTYNGAMVLESTVPNEFAVTQNSDGTLNFLLDRNAVIAPTNGRLGGMAQSAVVNRDRLIDVDALAAKYVTDVNAWHQAGKTPAGASGSPMLSIGADAATLQVLITDPADVAAASASGVVNGNLLAINSIRGAGTLEPGWTAVIAGHANASAATLAEETAATGRDEQAQQARADVNGIDLDREAADLLRLQQAYQGSARIIQVAREMMQTIFSILG